MEQSYHMEGCTIGVTFDPGIIRIRNDEQLWRLLKSDILPRTRRLVAFIKKDYLDWKAETLRIGDDSMVVEIWGHVYFQDSLPGL